MIVFRSGGDNVAYGNFFLNSGGVRIKEQNNVWVYVSSRPRLPVPARACPHEFFRTEPNRPAPPG